MGVVKLREICFEINDRADEAYEDYQLMALTNDGFVDKEITSKHPENYKLVYPYSFVYHVTKRMGVGRIGFCPDNEPIMCSPAYTVFESNEFTVLPLYLAHILLSNGFKYSSWKLLSKISQPFLSFDALLTLKIPLPPIIVQEGIMQAVANREIELLKKTAMD